MTEQPEISKETFKQMEEWIRYNYYKTVNYDGIRWHSLYGDMETIPDLIRILGKKIK
jgi:hypothetical protein